MKYSIDKSELFKMAWENAGKTFSRVATWNVIDGLGLNKYPTDFTDAERAEMIKNNPHLIKTTLRDCFPGGLKTAWEEARENINAEIILEKETAELELRMKIEKQTADAPRRQLVAAGKYNRGDMLGGYIVAGLGKTFRPNVDMFSRGITPDTERVQYAYFS